MCLRIPAPQPRWPPTTNNPVACGAVGGDGCGEDEAGLAEEGRRCGGVARDGALGLAGLLDGLGEVFSAGVQHELPGGLSLGSATGPGAALVERARAVHGRVQMDAAGLISCGERQQATRHLDIRQRS